MKGRLSPSTLIPQPELLPLTDQERTYLNPIMDFDFPDPTVIKTEYGYFAYGTQSATHNLQVAHSKDLINWQPLGHALVDKPKWSTDSRDFWAPYVEKVGDHYRMYYSSEPTPGYGHCIGLAISRHPVGFRDIGNFLINGPSYSTIDPHFFIDPKSGKHYLFYGSCFEPIRVRELDVTGEQFVASSQACPIIHPTPGKKYENLLEGAFAIYKEELDEYFVFVSGDDTWSNYATVVYRSKDVLGPYTRIPNDGFFLEANERWLVPGQGCVLTDAAHQDWYIYHAVDVNNQKLPGANHLRRVVCMDRINYDHGYPAIAGGQPSTTPQKAPIIS